MDKRLKCYRCTISLAYCLMMKKRMFGVGFTVAVVLLLVACWSLFSRNAYESAEYTVLDQEGSIEIREYPELTLVSTQTARDLQGNDGSFMRLFRYISGANESQQKIAMTTPVFMDDQDVSSMGFVIPKSVAAEGTPLPQSPEVTIHQRAGGRFAVIRFSGQLTPQRAEEQEMKLRYWMTSQDLVGVAQAEVAGYDPPFTPGPLRRNEVLIRLQDGPPSGGSSK